MLTDRFLMNRRNVSLSPGERECLEAAISEVRRVEPRRILVKAGDTLDHSTLLVEGIMSRHIDDKNGLRQLVAIHVPGDFVDLHAYPLKTLDHDVATMTTTTVGLVPHRKLDDIIAARPQLGRKLWYATLLDAAIHRGWLFRLGRLAAVGRVAHFLCETNARLAAVGLSDGRQFPLALTQADISEICGLTPVHINRVMRQLREERLCIFRSSIVEVLNTAGLAARGQFDPSYLYIDQ